MLLPNPRNRINPKLLNPETLNPQALNPQLQQYRFCSISSKRIASLGNDVCAL